MRAPQKSTKNPFCAGLLVLLAATLSGESVHGQEPRTGPVPAKAVSGPDASYQKYSKKLVDEANAKPIRVLLLGDSITAGWKEHPALFTAVFKDYAPANLGIGGDWTEMVIWRLQNGILDLKAPRMVLLMIGSNDIAGAPVDVPGKGVEAIVGMLRKQWPDTKILLMGVLPRSEHPGPLHDKIRQLNERIAKLDDGGKRVKYLNINNKLLHPNGSINKDLSHDSIHLTARGYQIWANSMTAILKEWLPPSKGDK